ncbi:exosortase C-terminal domain/associated protein EpsI [Methylophaga sp.]|jgi:EpsI family protein|uniref:exosortase C-terminal domain/associated protein EpsI n=1 Tax=Methylophaga sp. TaxID=2024840 RepID=UPI00140110EB|nr:exosortase C-terminal domain/associated protein EpsI [Methylophaga sp.]MTI62587.1 EpsI family protein [Methylophaga sp.]
MSWLKASTLCVLMILTATMAVLATPTDYLANIKHRDPLESYIEPRLDDWQLDRGSRVLVTNAVLDEKLESAYSDLISETYQNAENKKVMLSVAYSDNQRNGLAVHSPEACYPAQGFEILERKQFPMTLNDGKQITVRYMKTQRGKRIEPLVYWTMAGEQLYRNNLERKQVSIQYALNNIIPDGLIFRVSTIEADEAAALNVITDFIRDFHNSLAQTEQSRFFGTESTVMPH